MALATLSIDIEARLAKLQEGLDKAGRLAEKTGNEIEARNKRIAAASASLGRVIASAFAGYSVVEFIKSNADAVDALNDVSDATGSSIEKISGLEQVALRTGGNLELVSGVLVRFNKVISDADPESQLGKSLAAIGLSAKELRQLDPSEALQRTAQALSRYADDGNKARLIQELFGKSTKEAAPFLKDLAEAGEINGRVTREQAEEAERFNKALAEMKTNSTNTAREINAVLLPALNEMFVQYRDGKEIFGGVLSAMGNIAFGINPFKDWGANIAASNERIEQLRLNLKELQDTAANPPLLFNSQGNAERQKKINEEIEKEIKLREFAKRVQAREALATDDGSYRREDRSDQAPERIKPISSAKDQAATAAEQKRYENLIKKVQERLDVAKEELSIGGRLTESEKLRLDVMSELNSTTLTEPHKQRVKRLLDEAVNTVKLREEQESEIKMRQGIAAITERMNQAQAARIDALVGETTSMREANEEIGLTVRQVEELRVKRMESNLAIKEEELLMLQNSGSATDGLEQEIALLKERIRLRRESTKKVDSISRDALAGASSAMTEYLDQIGRVGDSTASVVGRTLNSLEDALTQFAATGKLNFKSFADEAIAQMMRILVVRPLLNMAANAAASYFGNSMIPASPYWAKGGAFGPSGTIATFAQGDVFDQPTGFRYGNNQMGVMGEAGPEAVMPLKRGRDGKLGVVAQGGGQAVNVVINIASGVSRNELAAMVPQIIEQAKASVVQAMRRPGFAGA